MGVRDRAEAARRRARRRDRQVGLDGRLPLQLVRRRHGRRRGHRRGQEDRHRQGGDPAGRRGAHRAGRVRRRRVRRVGPLGREDRAAGRRDGPPVAAQRASRPTARPTSSRASTRRCSRSRTRPRPGATSSCSPTAGPAAASTTRSSSEMKAAGITLSTVGAGGGANATSSQQLAQQRRRPLLRRREPVVDPRHLPQGDAAGLRPADRRGEVLPDPDLVVADPARASTAASRACWATTARPRSRPRRPCSSPRATTRSSPSGSTASAARWRGRRTRPAAGRRAGSAGTASRRSSARWSAGRSRARRAAASRRRSWTAAGGRTCASRASTTTARARDFYKTQVALVGPDLAPVDGRPEPGRAGRLRVAGDLARQRRVCRPRDPDQGRARRRSGGRWASWRRRRPSTGCSARTSRSWRRCATRPAAASSPCPAEAWVHDLQTTSRFTDLWPLLLVLALLLWPLDIALRRVSLGRRELADGRAWVADRVRGRRVVPPHAADRGPVRRTRACRFGRRPLGDHAPGRGARPTDEAGRRAARGDADRPLRTPEPTPAATHAGTRADRPAAAARRVEGAGARGPAAPPPAAPATPPAEGDTLARLREAKRRSRG